MLLRCLMFVDGRHFTKILLFNTIEQKLIVKINSIGINLLVFVIFVYFICKLKGLVLIKKIKVEFNVYFSSKL